MLSYSSKTFLVVAVVLLYAAELQAQKATSEDSLNLEACIQYAWANALSLRSAQLNRRQAEVQLEGSRANLFPSLNANASHGYNFGRTIDPFSNEFTTTQIRTNNLSLNSNWTLFNGFSIQRSVQQRAFEVKASQKEVEAARNDAALQVASAYLEVVRFREQVKRFESQLENTRERLAQVRLFVEEGVRNRSELLEVRAQQAQDKLQLTNAQNQLELSRLRLKQAMNYPGNQALRLASVAPDSVRYEEVEDLESIVASNLDRLPQLAAARLRENAASSGLAAAKGQRYPSVSLSSSINTGFSTQRRVQVGAQETETTDTVTFNGQEVPLTFTNQRPVFETPGFGNQLENNLGQSVRLSLNIPIFNNYRTRTNVRQAMVQQDRAALNAAQTAQQVRNDIYNAYTQRKAAYRQYRSAKKSLQAQRLLLDQVQLRREEDLASYYDFVQVRNNYNIALTQLLEAKYNFIFRQKVFEFYQGKPLIANP